MERDREKERKKQRTDHPPVYTEIEKIEVAHTLWFILITAFEIQMKILFFFLTR